MLCSYKYVPSLAVLGLIKALGWVAGSKAIVGHAYQSDTHAIQICLSFSYRLLQLNVAKLS